MAELPRRRDALDGLDLAERGTWSAAGEAPVELATHQATVLNLRGPSDDAVFVATVRGAIGAAPTSQPNLARRVRDVAVLWLGPGEWLIAAPAARRERLLQSLDQSLAALGSNIVDLSAGVAVLGISGARAREVLMKGCGMDLHPVAFGVGQCVQTRLAHHAVTIHCYDERPRFALYVSRSFARSLWRWLEDAALEYGFRVEVRGTK